MFQLQKLYPKTLLAAHSCQQIIFIQYMCHTGAVFSMFKKCLHQSLIHRPGQNPILICVFAMILTALRNMTTKCELPSFLFIIVQSRATSSMPRLEILLSIRNKFAWPLSMLFTERSSRSSGCEVNMSESLHIPFERWTRRNYVRVIISWVTRL
jgi:hypothetical protein